MYGYTASQIKTKAVISLALGVALAVYGIFFQETGTVNGTRLALYFLSPLALGWGFLGFLINWKKTLRGILLPIPLVSYLIEGFKGLFMAPVALLWALTHGER